MITRACKTQEDWTRLERHWQNDFSPIWLQLDTPSTFQECPLGPLTKLSPRKVINKSMVPQTSFMCPTEKFPRLIPSLLFIISPSSPLRAFIISSPLQKKKKWNWNTFHYIRAHARNKNDVVIVFSHPPAGEHKIFNFEMNLKVKRRGTRITTRSIKP